MAVDSLQKVGLAVDSSLQVEDKESDLYCMVVERMAVEQHHWCYC